MLLDEPEPHLLAALLKIRDSGPRYSRDGLCIEQDDAACHAGDELDALVEEQSAYQFESASPG